MNISIQPVRDIDRIIIQPVLKGYLHLGHKQVITLPRHRLVSGSVQLTKLLNKCLIINDLKILQFLQKQLVKPNSELLEPQIIQLNSVVDYQEIRGQGLLEKRRHCEEKAPVLGDPVGVEASDDVVDSEFCLLGFQVLVDESLLLLVEGSHGGEI